MPKSSSSPVISAGRILFALALIAFGVQYAIFGHLRYGVPLCPDWLRDNDVVAYAMAVIFIAGGLALLTAWRTTAVSLVLGLILLVSSVLYLQHLNFVLHTGNGRTVFLECLAIAATALVLHGLSVGKGAKLTLMPGRILFAFTLIVFGGLHFMYTWFLSHLVPAWIPWHMFWVVATGIAFIAAGVAIATTIADKIAALCLFAMFLIWLVILHTPRILHALHSGNEWSSGFVALAMCGASLLLAASSDHARRG